MIAPSRASLVLAATAALFACAAAPARATFSIAAYDSVTQELGVAVESRAFSVGMAVPWAEAGVGAIATQASTNESFGPMGLALLRKGKPAPEVLRALLAADSGSSHRQVGVVDVKGRSAAHTGTDCSSWAGHRTGPGYSIQGNLLAGEAVATEMERAFLSTKGDLSARLLAALEAGQAAGGDKRGQQSAAILVVRPSKTFPEYNTRYVDLRVEDHKEPIKELRRVYGIFEATDLAEAHLRFAEAYEKAGRKDLAQTERERVGESLKRALARGENDPSNLNGLAWTCAINGVFLPEALEAAERAVALEPKNTGILDTLAEVHFRMGNAAKAAEVGAKALDLEPNDNYLKAQLARFRAGAK
ncbi:MAG TPA: DUF1028 domain-containing protein [Candidatus Eisenbacteria bacterium]|nr:DUF1028 domain-containing protein [Candidatus Eisenbacteria bacterium]